MGNRSSLVRVLFNFLVFNSKIINLLLLYMTQALRAMSDLGLHCLHMSHKKDARLICQY